MINTILLNNKFNNISDILTFANDNDFISIFNSIDDTIKIKVTSNLIHNNEYISYKEQFLFNLDNYISFIKDIIKINQLELRYIINLTLYNKENKILLSKKYYYSNVNYYINGFKKMFMYNYVENIEYINKFKKIKAFSFEELVECINTNKKRSYSFFEKINQTNMNFYIPIIEQLIKSN